MSDGNFSMRDSHERQKEDVQLFRRTARGDERAYAELYDRFSVLLYSLALRILNDGVEAESVVQEIFAHIAESASTYRSDADTPTSWLVALTRTRALHRLVARRERGEFPADTTGGTMPDFTAPGGDPALHAPTAVEAEVMELAYFGGYTVPEISRWLNVPPETVTTHLHHAVFKLRSALLRHD